MTRENLRKQTLTKLKELRDTAAWLSEKYAKRMTTYATESGDMSFLRMDSETRHVGEKRVKLVAFIELIDSVIEEKITTIMNTDDVELD